MHGGAFIAVLKVPVSLEVVIILIQESFVGNTNYGECHFLIDFVLWFWGKVSSCCILMRQL